MSNATLNKQYSLKHNKLIEILFTAGNSVKKYPIVLKYILIESENDITYQVGFSVSKRKFKKAVDRNRIKRQMREGFRNNNAILINSSNTDNKQLIMMFIYTGNEIQNSVMIHQRIQLLCEKLSKLK